MLNIKTVAALLMLAGSGVAAQDSIEVPVDQASEVATRALFAGEVALALQIAEAVLTQNPDDRAALVVVAAAAPRLGDPTRGRQAGARAWSLSETDDQKYEAARLTALAAAGEERFTLSTFWLRRALNVTPNEEERARTLRDARIVTQRNPLGIRVSGSLVPSNNVNGGAEDEETDAPGGFVGTLSEDALALEGWRGSFNLGLQYRFQENQSSRTTAGLRYQIGRVRITEDTTVPDEAFDTSYYELSLRHDRVLENGTVSARLSRGLFEYESLNLREQELTFQDYDIWRIGIDRSIPFSERVLLSFSANREWLSYLAEGIGDIDRQILSAGATYRTEGGNRISVSLAFIDSESRGDNNVNYNSSEEALNIGYSWGQPVIDEILGTPFPISLSVGAGVRLVDYPEYRTFFPIPGGRQDTTYSINANVGFPGVEYAGFSPALRIDASQSDSNVSRFDRTTYSVGLTLNSSF